MSKKRRKTSARQAPEPETLEDGFGLFVDRAGRAYFLFLFVLATVFFIQYTLGHPIWSEYDEIANYDYIDKLGDGHFPVGDDDISDYSLYMTAEYFDFQHPLGWKGSVESMGLAGKSYQAQQPPFYPLVMTPLNLALKAMGVSPPREITTLRLMNVLWLGAASLLAIVTLEELHAMFGWARVYGYFVAAVFMSLSFNLRAHIGVDQLAPLMGGVFFYLQIRLWRTRDAAYIGWSALAAALTFLTKYTGGLCMPVWGLSMLYFWRRHPEIPWRDRILHCTPLLLVPLYLGFNLWRAGDLLNTAATDRLFAGALPQEESVSNVLGYLFLSSMDFSPVVNISRFWYPIPLALIAFHYVMSAYRVFVQRRMDLVPVFVACQISATIIVVALLMCGYRPGYWYTFRIYSAFTLPWIVSLTATPLLFRSGWTRGLSAVAGVLMATVFVYLRGGVGA